MSSHFGIEIEVSDSGFYSHNRKMNNLVKKHWAACGSKQEINCGSDHCGYEYRTPKMLTSLPNIVRIRKFIDGLQSEIGKNGFPNAESLFKQDTGMHVHVDVKTLNKAARNNMFKTFFLFEQCLLKCQPSCRTNNHWCPSITRASHIKNDPELINTLDFSSNCSWNNPLSRNNNSELGVYLSHRYPTVEVRYGRSTFNSDDVINWVLLLLIIVENARHMPVNFKVPFLVLDSSWPKKEVPASVSGKTAFLKFVENAQLDKQCMMNLRQSVACWVNSKISASRAIVNLKR